MKVDEFKKYLTEVGVPWQMYLDSCLIDRPNSDYWQRIIVECINPHEVIASSFIWRNTKQGHKFWYVVRNKLRGKKIKETGMNRREALQAMAEGKKVRQTDWDKYHYVEVNEIGEIRDHVGRSVDWNFIKDLQWEIYEEPKKKVKYYLPKIINGKQDGLRLSGCSFFELKKEDFKFKEGDEVIEWYEIEVEE